MTSRTNQSFKWGVLLGNLFEHYDTALFSLLSPFLAPLFFPTYDPITAILLTYAIIPLGMLARPFGALFFGYIGDTRGRRTALILSLSGLACVTACMGLIPTYEKAGFLAPILLSFFRLLQNFLAAGENVGGAIYLMENSSESRQDWISSLFNASTIAGILLASSSVSILYFFQLINDYWRLLYFFGFLTAFFAFFLRSQADLPKVSTSHSLKELLRGCWERKSILLTVAIASGFSYTSYTIALVMFNGLIPLITTITKEEITHLTTFLLVIDFLLLPLFGFLAQRYSREKMMITAGLLATVSGLPLFALLPQATFMSVILIRLCLVVIGVGFSAPFYAWAKSLVPPAYRYTLISFSYAIGSQLFGGPSAMISLWFFHQTGYVTSVAWYWMGLGLISSGLIFFQWVQSKQTLTAPHVIS